VAIVKSMEFDYKGKTYFALVRKRVVNNEEQFHVKIMNSVLEGQWFGHHVVIGKNGIFHLENEVKTTDLLQLRKAILSALAGIDWTTPEPVADSP